MAFASTPMRDVGHQNYIRYKNYFYAPMHNIGACSSELMIFFLPDGADKEKLMGPVT
jgi:hypothetical protein